MIAIDSRATDAASSARARRRESPCSQAQLRFWFEEQLHPRNAGLNVAVRWRLEGELSDAVLGDAWRRLVARHASLRTSFASDGGEPTQVVDDRLDFSVRSIDLRSLSGAEATLEAARLAGHEARTPFDIAVPPLIRVTRLLIDDRASELLVTAHHTICDGWSIGILAQEMGLLCAALAEGDEPTLPGLPIDYAEFSVWDRERVADGSLAPEKALAERLMHAYKPFEVLPDLARPALQTSNGAIVSVLLDRALTDAVTKLARERGCTLFMTSLAALVTLLHRYSGETDITLGSQVVGRDEVELERVVGCFINTIALRNDVSGDPTFLELLERTRAAVSAALDIRELPLEALIDIVKPKRDLSRNALFSVNFIYQRSFIENATYGRFTLTDLPSRSAGALYDLNFFMVERPEGWRIACEYNADLFEQPTVSGMLDRLHNVFAAIVADPEERVSTVPLLSAADRRSLIVDANATRTDYPADRTVAQLFAAQVARTPQAPALVCDATTLTYAELDAASSRLARLLVLRGHGPGERIGVALDRSPDLVIALLAVLKCGSAYIPLDPYYPANRLSYIVDASRLSAVITHSTLHDRLPDCARPLVDVDEPAIAEQSGTPFDSAASPDDVAYVIFTSGSTGLPKGVAVGQRALVNLLFAMRERPGLGPTDTLVAVTTIAFDIAGLELWLPLVTGAKLVVATNAEVVDADALLLLLRRHQATVMQATPVTWRLLIDAGWQEEGRLKILCGGEALTRRLADELVKRGEVWNLYGPTETTIWSACARVGADEPIVVGRPIANTQFYVLDANTQLVPPGAPGELYIGGDGVALEYFDRPDLTAERFVPDTYRAVSNARLYRTGDIVRMRSNATFEYLGRRDQQIKLRGFRIELGEIEAALLRDPAIAQAVALVGEDALGEPAIWAAIVLGPGTPQPTQAWFDALRLRLGEFLPKYMLPAPIVAYDALPQTPNGKVDRAAIVQPHNGLASNDSVSAIESPVGATEASVAQIVTELLGRERIGRNDDFFTLGLHSLLAVRLVARIAQTLDVKLPLRAVFDHPTLAALARRIEQPASAIEVPAVRAPIVTYNSGGTQPPFLYFHNDVWFNGAYCRRVAEFIGRDQPFVAIAPHGTAGLDRAFSIETMALDYYARIRELVPVGPYRIGGFCAGGSVAYEVARLLRARGETLEQVVLVNASAPPRRAVLFGDLLLRRIGLNPHLDPLVREKFCWNIVRLFDAIGDGPKPALRFLSARLQQLVRRLRRAGATRPNNPELFEKRRGTVETENYFANLISAYTYHPRPYDGDVTLLWGTAEPTVPGDSTVGWGTLARHVRVLAISGGHMSPLNEGVEELGNVLKQLFKRTSR